MYICLLTLILIQNVFSQDCITYNFEENYETLFGNEFGLCDDTFEPWIIGSYNDDIENLFDGEQFISSLRSSCISSGSIDIRLGGELEVNVFINGEVDDSIAVIVNSIVEQEDGNLSISSLGIDFALENGWQVLRIPLENTGANRAFITFVGQASEDSIVLVDSYRYVAPDFEGECEIYPDTTTTTAAPTEPPPVTEPPENTENPSTQPPSTENPATTDPNTQPPSTENPNTQPPSTEDPDTENPNTQPPITEDPATENPNTQPPSTGDPATENPNTQPPSTEDPATENPNTQQPTTENPDTQPPSTENATTDTPIDPTEEPTNGNESFWTPLTITMVVLVSFIVLGLLCFAFFYIGKLSVKNEEPQIVYADVDDLPKPALVPRVTRVFSDSSTIYSGRY